VNEYGSAKINGELQPFDYRKQSTVNMQFRNIDTKSLTPYTAKIAGRKIESGSMSLDLDYKINNSQLNGSNNIVLQSLVLGERVESPDAIDLPLDMAISLLQDDEGRIDIDVPISGDLSNPEFQLDTVIQKAIGNLIGGIVTAPFKFIGQLFGGSGEDLKDISFEAGSDAISLPEAENLKTLSQALVKRPSLTLTVTGAYDTRLDTLAIARQQLITELANSVGHDITPLNFSDPELQVEIKRLARDRLDNKTLESLQDTYSIDNKSADQTKPNEVDYFRDMFDRMQKAIVIPAEQLEVLAKSRARVIIDKLVELENSIAPRVKTHDKTVSFQSEGKQVNVTLEAGSIK
jgi:hypothetical protein